MTAHQSFRMSRTPVMQLAFFWVSVVVAVVGLWAGFADQTFFDWQTRGWLAAVAFGALAANLPWLVLCGVMRRRLRRRIARIGKGMCAWCAYDTTGLPVGSVCPECGRTAEEVVNRVRRMASWW